MPDASVIPKPERIRRQLWECVDSDVIVITRRKASSVVMMSLDEYNSIRETAYVLHSPANAGRLPESVEKMR